MQIQTEAIDIREKLYVELDHRTEQNASERYITAIKQPTHQRSQNSSLTG